MNASPRQPSTSGLSGVWEREDPNGISVPVVFDSPHSGDLYPDDFGHIVTMDALRSAEDMYVDQLFGDAPSYGASLLRALFPRSYIDVNRRALDLDEDMLAGSWPEPLQPGGKTRNGKGLLRTRAKGLPLYDRQLRVAEVQARLDGFYTPYHEELERLINSRHADFGAVWHVNCHSWTPPVTGRNGGPIRQIDFCLGDRDGETCAPEFTATVASYLEDRGYGVRVNRPFKGMELIRRHSLPEAGKHSLQIEISRHLYMDKHHYGKLDRFHRLKEDLGGLMETICDYAEARTSSTDATGGSVERTDRVRESLVDHESSADTLADKVSTPFITS